MRTLDRNYLAANPEGDERAKFAVSALLPETVDVAPNPDGTRPSVTLDVEADTFALGLTVMEHLHDNPDELIFEWLLDLLTDEQTAELEASTEETGPPAFLAEVTETLHEKFLVHANRVTITIATTEDGDDAQDAQESVVEHDIDLTITAPSLRVGIDALHSLTSSKRRTQLAIAFSPEREDEDYDDGYSSNEVLVIG